VKFSAQQTEMSEALQRVSAVVPSRTTFPILSNLLIEAEKDKVSLKATDLELAISTSFQAEVKKPGAITVPAKQFSAIVKDLPASPIQLSVEGKKASLECDKRIFKFMGIEKEEFPAFPQVGDRPMLPFSSSAIDRAIRKGSFAISTDAPSRPALSGALWQLDGDAVKLVATDGHRLARIRITIKELEAKTELIVPPKALAQLTRLIAESAQETFDVNFNDKYIGFYFQNTTLVSKLIEGPYPNIDQVIPSDNKKTLKVSVPDLLSAVRRVSNFSDSYTHQIKLTLKKDALELHAATPDLGEAKETLTCSYRDEDLVIGYNGAYLTEILKNIDTDQVVFKLNTSLSAGVITPEKQKEGEEILYLLMPIRLPE
jgi:DNA polymerase-3 subunit beta